jgi:hypothetical protein
MAPSQQTTLAPSSHAAHDGRWLDAAGLCRCKGVVNFFAKSQGGPPGRSQNFIPFSKKKRDEASLVAYMEV